MNKKKIGGLALLAAGGVTALAAAAIPMTPVAPSSEPVPGIINDAENYATPNAAAEQGVRDYIHHCMAAAGFDYTPQDAAAEVDLHANVGFERLDIAGAKANGYASPSSSEPDPASPLGQLFADPAFQVALNGDPSTADMQGTKGYGTSTGGCRGEAATAIYGSMENYALATVVALNSFSQATGSVASDPELNQIQDQWKACMAETAYNGFQTVQEAKDAALASGGQNEIKIAVTDATCRDEIGLHDQLDQIFDRYLTTAMRELEPEIKKVTEIRRIAVENATELATSQEK
ncbi:hypothetical protein [Arthrobacter sp. 260]|uniref:hypothetical protein n=1 Tax=Arthrobacter sp. 260 TaxID=2735314 RepID=UPI0014920E55|nr:hypothetical protein [Arthrobacter sp. 260]NOJ61789.1 hypothetical protein [Arthrobacter sp. 260]